MEEEEAPFEDALTDSPASTPVRTESARTKLVPQRPAPGPPPTTDRPSPSVDKLPPSRPPRPSQQIQRGGSGEGKAPARAEAAAAAAAPESEDDWRDIAEWNVVSVGGVDKLSRPVVVFSCANLPPKKTVDMDRLLQYMKLQLDKIVESDYSIVYFHHGLSSQNKPGINWIKRVYFGFDRKYKKNLKAMYVVHATTFVRVILGLCRPFISSKFGKKLTWISQLSELEQYIHIEQIDIPGLVKSHDLDVVAQHSKGRAAAPAPAAALPPAEPLVFGADLASIEAVDARGIPLVMINTITYLLAHGLDTEGIFRRSANANLVKEVKLLFNEGKSVAFEKYDDIHLPAVLLKTFLRELQEPLLTFAFFNAVVRLSDTDVETKTAHVRQLLATLPHRNRVVLKYLMDFLADVVRHSDVNRMTDNNMAIVFGPNLLWAGDQAANLSSMGKVNSFTQFLLVHHDALFA